MAALPLLLAIACDGDSVPVVGGLVDAGPALEADASLAEAGGQDAADDLPPGDPVIGLWRGLWVTGHSEVRLGFGLKDLPVSVFAEAPGGQFSEHAGGGDDEGGFVVTGVPAVPHWLHFHDLYLAGGPGQPPFDILQPVLGRLATEPATPGTVLQLAVDGIAPWQRRDSLYLFAPDAGTYLGSLESAGPLPLRPGATRLEADLDAGEKGVNLVQGLDSGDVTHVVQMVAAPSPTLPGLVVARRAFQTSELQMTAGAPARLTGTLQEIATEESATITWRHRALADLARQQPGAEPSWQEIAIVSLPGAVRHGKFATGGTLMEAFTAEPTGMGDETAASISWGNPFPVHWGRVLWHQTSFLVQVARGSEPFWGVFGYLGGSQLIAPGQTVTVAPGIGAPRDIRIGDRDPAGDLTGVGLHPVISWTPPAFGTPNAYAIEILVRPPPQGARPATDYKGTLVVTGTSARLPPGLLEPDRWAVAVVRAVANPHYGPRNPHRPAPQMAWADAISPAFKP